MIIKLKMMKDGIKRNWIILFSIILLAVMSFSVYAGLTVAHAGNIVADKYIEFTMVNQEPDPVEPGKMVTVKFKIANYGKYDTGDITAGIEPDFPFTLVRGQSYEKNIGLLEARQFGDKSEIIEWKLLIDKDAPEGDNNITIYYKEFGSAGIITFEESFAIDVRTSDAVIHIFNISSDPGIVEPGKETTLKIGIKNIADSFIKDVKVTMDLNLLDISTIGSTNQQIIQKLDGGKKKVLEYQIIPDADIDVAVHEIPLEIEFKDNVNNLYEVNHTFGLRVSSPVQYLIYVDDSEISTLNKFGEVSIKISNPGVNDIKFLTAELKSSPSYEILSTPTIYVGKVESDDYETVGYDIYANEFDEDNIIILRLLMKFTDSFNEEFVVEEEVPLRLFSSDEAQKYGIVAKPSYTGLVVLVLLIVAGVWFYLYRRKKKKQMMDGAK